MRFLSPDEIDALLPQTQCQLCGYAGCKPYAEAIIFEDAPINLCPPGGVQTLQALGDALQEDPSPYVVAMQQKSKPQRLAVIREAACIGCTKCIQVCPVDAILGSAKHMHTILVDECTGCELCVPACPVDCIDILALPETSPINQKMKAEQFRVRFNRRKQRLAEEKEKKAEREKAKRDKAKCDKANSLLQKKNYIREALIRVRLKKNSLKTT